MNTIIPILEVPAPGTVIKTSVGKARTQWNAAQDALTKWTFIHAHAASIWTVPSMVNYIWPLPSNVAAGWHILPGLKTFNPKYPGRMSFDQRWWNTIMRAGRKIAPRGRLVLDNEEALKTFHGHYATAVQHIDESKFGELLAGTFPQSHWTLTLYLPDTGVFPPDDSRIPRIKALYNGIMAARPQTLFVTTWNARPQKTRGIGRNPDMPSARDMVYVSPNGHMKINEQIVRVWTPAEFVRNLRSFTDPVYVHPGLAIAEEVGTLIGKEMGNV